jgi:hypothetical protein
VLTILTQRCRASRTELAAASIAVRRTPAGWVTGRAGKRGDEDCSPDSPFGPLRRQAYDLAELLSFPEVGVFQDTTGSGAEAWRAWLQDASDGRVKTMTAVLEMMIWARKGRDV